MEFSTDPYEYKLYQMFQSCDTNQCGFLNENSLRRLCAQLELHDKGSVLIENLAKEGRTSHITFENFKEALLNFLGNETEGATTIDYRAGQRKDNVTETDEMGKSFLDRALVISEQQETFIVDSPPELSDREVSPKLVVGSKKYGRRSRPHRQTKNSCSNLASDSDDTNDEKDAHSHRSCNTQLVKRSTSQVDISGFRTRSNINAKENKLKRCASLPAQKNLFNQNKTKLVSNKVNFGRDSSVSVTKTTLSSSVESLGLKNISSEMHAVWSFYDLELSKNPLKAGYLAKESQGLIETLPVNSIIDLWERSSIPNGRGILLALGFSSSEINIAQLNKVMEEEIPNLEEEPQMALTKACLVLQSEELGNLRQYSKQLRDENVKLRADNKDANRRIALLAAEIDERHASLEDATKKEIRILEQRHAGVVRDLTTRLANDRENWCSLNARLELKLKSFEQEEIKLKTELELVKRENEDLDGEKQKMQKQITELLEQNIKLEHKLSDMDEISHSNSRKQQYEKSNDDEEILRLLEKISTLQVDNCNLRDKNDELIADVENLNHELNKLKIKLKKCSVNQDASNTDVDDIEINSSSTAIKRRGDSPSKARLIEESPRLGKLRKCTNDLTNTCSENSDTSGEWMALNSELNKTQTKCSSHDQSEIEKLKKIISELEDQLKQAKDEMKNQSLNTSSSALEERCRELELSLEQMQKAYEDCEDYWQAKLTEERNLFEKERQIYEEEQQESDKKFTELMEKVREYEEQFSKDGRLSPIEEKDLLEQQYADLEAEAEEIRENARKMFEEKSKEIEALQTEIEDLKVRLGESVEIITGAYELKTETVAHNSNIVEANSPASSPISYLWHQSTIHEPSKACQPLETNLPTLVSLPTVGQQTLSINLSTSETTIFSTTPQNIRQQSPIEKPNQSQNQSTQSEAGDVADCETSSTASGKSFETHSIHSNNSAYHFVDKQSGMKSSTCTKNNSPSPTPSVLKDELKRLKYFEISLRDQIKDLSLQRDGLIMELQQLHEAKPVLEKAYARTSHPSLIQRVNQLELKNRHLQNVIKQQHQYTESIMQQSWRHHQIELNDLHGRLESQSVLIAEQVQRLQNADVLVKDLYVENSHLTASVQRLEQQRVRVNMLQQQQHRQTCTGFPGIP